MRERGTRLPSNVVIALLMLVPAAAAAGDWPYLQGDMGNSSRSDGVGAMSATPTELPGVVNEITSDLKSFRETWLLEIDGDGTADIVTALQGKIQAFSGADGHLLWSTPLTYNNVQLLALADFDGDGLAQEVAATTFVSGGGVYVIDAMTGGLLWQFTATGGQTGVQQYLANEFEVFDANGDGADDLFFVDGFYGAVGIYLVDFSAGFDAVEIATTDLPVGFNSNRAVVAGPLAGSGEDAMIMVMTWSRSAIYSVCSNARLDAQCSANDAICLCQEADISDVHGAQRRLGIGRYFDQDLNGDGTAEVVDVLSNPLYGHYITVQSVATALAAGTPTAADLHLWEYNYGDGASGIRITQPRSDLVDVSGDGVADLVVTFYNNTNQETDHLGVATDDGISNANGFTVAVFDGLTGTLHGSIDNVYAWGVEDLDNDGTPEIVVSPTSGWDFQAGLQGYILDCTGACTLSVAWQVAQYTQEKDLDKHDNASFPVEEILTVDIEQDGNPELLAYRNGALRPLAIADGIVTPVGTALPLVGDADVSAVDPDGSWVAVSGAIEPLRLYAADLSGGADPLPLPGQSFEFALAVQFDPASDVASLVIHGAIYQDLSGSPAGTADATFTTARRQAFAQDLTGDGYLELVSFEDPNDRTDGRLYVEVVSYNPADPDGDGTPFGVLWTFVGANEAAVAGYELRTNGDNIRPADVDADGDDDLVLLMYNSSTAVSAMLVLDGRTGVLRSMEELSYFPAGKFVNAVTPLWIEDIVDMAGAATPDGRDDLVFAAQVERYVMPGGTATATASRNQPGWYTDGMFSDVDGDGVTEFIGQVHNNGVMWSNAVDDSLTQEWVTTAVGTPMNFSLRQLSAVQADGLAGFEVAVASGDGGMYIRSGTDGSPLAGFPVFLHRGQIIATPASVVNVLISAASYDVDGDGLEEVLIGDKDGYLYAMNVATGEASAPSVEWSMYLGTPIMQIGIADVDGDGDEELFVSGPNSKIQVLDGIGVQLAITDPSPDECLGRSTFEVAGTASNVDAVEVFVGGLSAGYATWPGATEWSLTGVTPPGIGVWQVEAVGYDTVGTAVILEQVLVAFYGDGDGDTWTLCGGDCNDADPALTPADADEDGLSSCAGDCDDTSAALNLADVDEDGTSSCAGDCDDTDPALNVDDADSDGASTCEGDCDDASVALNLLDADSDGDTTCDGDCDDADNTIGAGDRDGDLILDCVERDVTNTDPQDDDTDDDGLLDGNEDVDQDGVVDADETSATDPDTDNDGLQDGTELGLSAPQGDDTGAGFVPDADPASTTDPLDEDTDDGSVSDGDEDTNLNGQVDTGERDPNDPSDDVPVIPPDAGPADGGLTDAGAPDASPADGGSSDAGGETFDAGGETFDASGEAFDASGSTPDANTNGSDAGAEPDARPGSGVDLDGDGFVDNVGSRGGGCACTTSGSGGPAQLAWLLLGGIFLLRRRRRPGQARQPRGTLVALACVGAIAGATATVSAQTAQEATEFSLERLQLATERTGIIDVEWPGVLPRMQWDAGLWLGYAHQPLVIYSVESDSDIGSLVQRRVGGSLMGAIGFGHRLQLGLELPLVLYQGRDSDQAGVSPQPLPDLGAFGVGDLRLIPKVQVASGVAVQLGISLPSGRESYRGGTALLVAPELLFGRQSGAWRYAANVGFRMRNDAQYLNQEVDHELTARLGLAYRLWEQAGGGAPVELASSLSGATAAASPFDKANQNAFEWHAMAGYRPVPAWLAFVGGGLGLSDGFGTPKWRLFAGVRFGSVGEEKPTTCPDAPGCPPVDSDGDGIPDSDDGAPNEAEDVDGFEDRDGIPDPDNDGDGVNDADDRCPDVPGIAEAQGCHPIDGDGDGIPDHKDKCAGEPEDMDGFQDDDGCPETDNDSDGVVDTSDRCPLEEGVIENRGCPDTDRDGDSVVDRLDNCPDEAGTEKNHGCKKKQRVQITDSRIEIAETVYFKTNQDIIRRRSFPLLNNVASVLVAHPEIGTIRIEGHTDDRGSDDHNMELSQRRAESVRNYLVGKGVPAERLNATGYGETRPVVPNDSSSNRATNRRVVFAIVDPAVGDGNDDSDR